MKLNSPALFVKSRILASASVISIFDSGNFVFLFKTLPENKGLSNAEIKKKYKNSIYAQPKYDSIDDYVAAWNQTKRNGYLQKVNKIIEPDDDVYNLNLLPEYEVISNGQVVEPSYVTKDDRLDYFNNNITTDLFINQGEGQVIAALEQVMPEGFELEEEGYFGRDQVRITHKGSDDTIVVDVDYSDDAEGRRYARHNLKVFNNIINNIRRVDIHSFF